VLTVLGVLGFAPAIATAGQANTIRGQEWWLASLHVTQAWPQSEGAGIVVAVLGTGVDASYPGLAGSVITGPDYTGSGRVSGSPYWGVEGTAVAGLIAAHARGGGMTGVAPEAKILSVRVTLEFNDPLAAEPAISRRLPQAIADGIRYATDHGARIIDLPLDPGTLGLTSKGDPAAAGGSAAERAAVGYALSKGVVLVAPAGDDGQGSGIVNYPAAYPGVIAVGAVDRGGHLASFSSKRSYPSLTAPGVRLVTAAPPTAFGTISSTSTASGIVAGVAALILSRFPHLTVAQVTQALIESTASATAGTGLPPLPARSATGAGYGTVDALRAMNLAAVITAGNQPRPAVSSSGPSAAPTPTVPARHTAAAPRRPAAGTLAGSVLRDAVAAVGGLIVLLIAGLLVVRSRRDRGGPGRGAAPARARGQHENRGPATAAGFTPDGLTPAGFTPADGGRTPRPAQATRPSWASPGGWQGGGIGEIRPFSDASYRPVVAPAAKPAGGRAGRGATRPDGSSGPPWAPAPEPARLIGPLPVASAGLPPPEQGRGIRVPGDMAAPSDASPPVTIDLTTPPADFDLSTPAFGLTRPSFDAPPPAFEPASPPAEAGVPGSGRPADEALPTRQSLGFAAAPVPSDFAVPPAELEPEPAPETAVAADPTYIWDLAATDVFPPAAEAAVPQDEASEADEG
jgi:subtilisin family serine protease